jgi:hypothetical protein
MMNEKGKYIRFDWAVRRILRDKANFGVLEGFLTVLIGEKITIKEIIESEGNQEDAEDKFNRVDIMAINSKGELIIVEIQNSREAYYLERILYGVAKAITDHMEVGDSYSVVKKVYSISILYFNIGRGSDYLYHGQNKFIGVNTGDTLQVDAREKSALVPCNPKDIFPEYFLIRVSNRRDSGVIARYDDPVKKGEQNVQKVHIFYATNLRPNKIRYTYLSKPLQRICVPFLFRL